jgi:hypothetical protein
LGAVEGETQVRRIGERRFRLHRVARRLKPRPETMPYYLHSGRSTYEQAAGWYFTPAGAEHPAWLADNAVDAEIRLRGLVERQEA